MLSTTMSVLSDLVQPVLSKVVETSEEAIGSLLGDSVAPVETPNVIISDQSAVSESEVYETNQVPPALSASSVEQEVGQMNIQRYVRIQSGNWPGSILAEAELARWELPDVFNQSKFPTSNLMKNYIWMRSDYEFNLIVNANMGFAGALVLVYVPNDAHFEFKTFRNFPHAIINCALNTSARLKIPYINRTQYCGIQSDPDNCGTIRLYVLASLKVPTTGGQSANWTIYGKLLAPEFQAFAVLEGNGNEAVRVEEAAGGMFLASRHHTAIRPRMGLTSEHGEPDERVVGDSAYTSLKQVTSIESLWMALDWSYTDEVGKRLLITNVKLQSSEQVGGISNKTNLGFLGNFYLAYQGDLVVTIQAVASRLNQGKLLVVFYPGDDNAGKDVTMEKTNNSFTQILDLGGKTTVRFTLPYVCQQTYRPVSGTHGRFAVFVLNPLTYVSSSPSSVRILFYIGTGSSFNYVYPKQSAVKFQGPGQQGEMEKAQQGSSPVTNIEDETTNTRVVKRPVFRNVKVSLPRQIRSDHMLLDNLKGRAFPLQAWTSGTTGAETVTLTENDLSFFKVFKLFMYRSGDMTIHLSHTAEAPVYMAHSYIQTTMTGTSENDRLAQILSQGAVCVMPTSALSMCVPYYVMTPFIKVDDFGTLFVQSQNDTTYKIWPSLTFDSDTKFYFLQSPPSVESATVEEDTDLEWFPEEEGVRGSVWQMEISTIQRYLTNTEWDHSYRSGEIRGEDQEFIMWFGELTLRKGDVEKKFRANSYYNSKTQLNTYRQAKTYVRSLVADGDVESNPGPAIFRHQLSHALGVKERGWIYHCPNKNFQDGRRICVMQERRPEEIQLWKFYCNTRGEDISLIWNRLNMDALEDLLELQIPFGSPDTNRTCLVMTHLKNTIPAWLFRPMLIFLRFCTYWDRSTNYMNFMRLCLCGDVEENPGPTFKYFMTGEDRAKFSIKTKSGVPIQISASDTFSAIGSGVINVDRASPESWRSMRFSNAVSKRLTLHGGELMQGCTITAPVGVDVTEEEVALLIGLSFVHIVYPEGIFTDTFCWLFGMKKSGVERMQIATELLADGNISKIVDGISGDLMKACMKGLIRVVIYTLILSISDNAVVQASVAALAAMDVGSTLLSAFQNMSLRRLLEYLIPENREDGDYTRERTNLLAQVTERTNLIDNNTPTQQGQKEFNTFTTVAKNLTWWIQKIKELADFLSGLYNPDRVARAVKELAERSDTLTSDMARVLEMQSLAKVKGVLPIENLDEWKQLSTELGNFHKLSLYTTNTQLSRTIGDSITQLNRIRLPQEPTEQIRCDPVAVHFVGKPGQGKTVLMTRLTNLLANQLNTTVYTHATGSRYFDGYTDQGVHYIDEFLASTEEAEADMILQLLGCSQVILPMADLAEKGKFYKGEVMITTSNTNPVSNGKLKSENALKRRFRVVDFRANQKYLCVKNGEVVFNVEYAISDGSFTDGNCWEIQENGGKWVTFSFKAFASSILKSVYRNRQVHKAFLKTLEKDVATFQGGPGGEEEDLENIITNLELTSEKERNSPFAPIRLVQEASVKTYNQVDRYISQFFSNFKEETFHRFVTRVSSAMMLLKVVHQIYSFFKSTRAPEEQRAYNPSQKLRFAKVIRPRQETQVEPQGGNKSFEYRHLVEAMVDLQFGDADPVSALCIGGRSIMTYMHGVGDGPLTFEYKGRNFTVAEDKYHVEVFDLDGTRMDLAKICIDPSLGIEFTNMWKHVATPIFHRDGILVRKDGPFFEKMDVGKVTDAGVVMLKDASGQLVGMRSGQISYYATTSVGYCGSLILQKQYGTWKIVAMHNAGRKGMAYGARLDTCAPQQQGVVEEKKEAPCKFFQPTKSNLKKSPFYNREEHTLEPAPLSTRDKRIEAPIDNLTKNSSNKYRVNKFEPIMNNFHISKMRVKERLQQHVRYGYSIPAEVAITGEGTNPVDQSTSPGLKYTQRNLTKKDLYTVNDDGTVTLAPHFAKDVEEQNQILLSGGYPTTVFTACLKDELRTKQKVKEGKTRVIEACEFDYVVLYRMHMNSIYSDLYKSSAVFTGIGAGINPLAEGNHLHEAMSQYDAFLALDYSKFDGSLSESLMRHAVDILADLHEDPGLVKRLHEPVIMSKHLVVDEFWSVRGGMPSGSPCTTVLNCICNLLVLDYAMLMHHDVHEVEGALPVCDYLSVVYGDDCVVAYDGLAMGNEFAETIRSAFGMEVTPASKEGYRFNVELRDVEFLKRKFVDYVTEEGFQIVTLGLDPEVIKQHLMWMKSASTFNQQIYSLMMEMAVHGQQAYDTLVSWLKDQLKESRAVVNIPEYRASKMLVDGVICDD
ncbi:polyprotein [Clownfish picornavirus]|nr:polyprotein [Clownfish picornavirus]